jgi:hypothetical protein
MRILPIATNPTIEIYHVGANAYNHEFGGGKILKRSLSVAFNALK